MRGKCEDQVEEEEGEGRRGVPWGGGRHCDLEAAAATTAATASRWYPVIGARGGGGLGGRHCGGTWSWGGGGGGGGGGRSHFPIFLEQPLEREFTPFFLQMTTRVCGGSLPLLLSPKWAERGKGPLEAHNPKPKHAHRK